MSSCATLAWLSHSFGAPSWTDARWSLSSPSWDPSRLVLMLHRLNKHLILSFEIESHASETKWTTSCCDVQRGLPLRVTTPSRKNLALPLSGISPALIVVGVLSTWLPPASINTRVLSTWRYHSFWGEGNVSECHIEQTIEQGKGGIHGRGRLLGILRYYVVQLHRSDW